MKNKEKYAKEIIEIACSGSSVAIARDGGKLVQCNHIKCYECLLDSKTCNEGIRQWAESEYIEKPVISKKDRAFLMYLREELKSIARDKDGKIFAFTGIAKKDEDKETFVYEGVCRNISYSVNIDFPMVR